MKQVRVLCKLPVGEWKQNGGVLLMGYEMYRLLASARPSMSSSKMLPVKKKKPSNQTNRPGQELEVIDLDEEEKNMDLIIGKYTEVLPWERTVILVR